MNFSLLILAVFSAVALAGKNRKGECKEGDKAYFLPDRQREGFRQAAAAANAKPSRPLGAAHLTKPRFGEKPRFPTRDSRTEGTNGKK